MLAAAFSPTWKCRAISRDIALISGAMSFPEMGQVNARKGTADARSADGRALASDTESDCCWEGRSSRLTPRAKLMAQSIRRPAREPGTAPGVATRSEGTACESIVLFVVDSTGVV